MHFDVFFSICQTPVAGYMPDEATMFGNFFEQVQLADRLGYGCAWIAESHLSTEVQKRNRRPVVPHFQGEIGLNVDFFQLAHKVFGRTERIECGSAVMNIVCNGGPIAAAERTAAFLALHGLDPEERRRIHIGFSAGRFDFMNRAYGVVARDVVEEAAWPAYKGQLFREACDVFLRLLAGEIIDSSHTVDTVLTRDHFRSDADWAKVQDAWVALHGGVAPRVVPFAKRWEFEEIKVIPQAWRRELLELVVGSHDPKLQEELNRHLPVKVFNLSITAPEVIDATHARMAEAFHPDGGPWQRAYMPRTVMVFLNAEEGLSDAERSAAAQAEAEAALSEYWNALEGTLDPAKVAAAAGNALVGNPQQVAAQLAERFHPEDRVMLWFDFYNHDSPRVMRNMRAFTEQVVPALEGAQA